MENEIDNTPQKIKLRYINAANCKKYLIEQSKVKRGGKFTRVSRSVLELVNRDVQEKLDSILHSHPSVGKTIK